MKKGLNKNFKFKNDKGTEYEVLFQKPNKKIFGSGCDGTCEDPTEKSPKIRISPYLSKQAELNTILHEFAHAFFWDKSEKEVYKFSGALSRFLYRECGWRKTERRRKTRYKGK